MTSLLVSFKLLRYISNPDFRAAKERISLFKAFEALLKEQNMKLDEQVRVHVLQSVLEGNVEQAKASIKKDDAGGAKHNWIPSAIRARIDAFLSGASDMKIDFDNLHARAKNKVSKFIPEQFWSHLDQDVEQYAEQFPLFKELVDRAKRQAHEHLQEAIPKVVNKLTLAVQRAQEDDCKGGITRHHEQRVKEEQNELRMNLIKCLNGSSARVEALDTLFIEGVREEGRWTTSHSISGMRSSKQDPVVVHTIHLMNLTTQDQHELQLDSSAIPSPRFQFHHTFKLSLGHWVVRAQLLEGEKLLLIIADRVGNLTVYLDRLAAIQSAIARGRGKPLNREKIGQDFLLAYDESKKILAVISSSPDKLQLHIFVFDDSRGSFQASGSSINLHIWYNEVVAIRHTCFVSGSEELVLVDSQAQARVFSLVTLQFRPATLQLEQIPHSVSSTPDGACLLVTQAQGNELTMTAYHWSTFGSSEGTKLDLAPLTIENGPVVTSLINRTAVHVIMLDFEAHACRSHALDITRKVTEFTFKQKGTRGSSARRGVGADGNPTAHNCLIDCHAEVWTRFPVLPAVQRETISSSSLRSARTLVFVTDRDYARYTTHFAEMISSFERATKKPIGDILKSIQVSAASFAVFAAELCGDGVQPNATQNRAWNVSAYRAGEWLVDFLCLIPIHLALARDNRFVPLKDGVYSPELERSLLGADVNRIVDSLSFGWYESLFQSYMASKPVRVVSSMGEQSEGVWMSVTPTKDALIVALDFEGVHSIERSAQEDTLLVLFNTAVSNLVLFRNNFALSRDITGLFQSFQSSSTVLDPKANPSLFQSTLVIIIKDVVDSDKAEIAKEFSLKFQRIVQDEQEANFISRLHAGKLNIIPWPVIESKEFYKLFPALKRRRANDWGAMSQTMAAHRAQLISTLLGNALAFGYAEIHPEHEPLKDLDSDTPIDMEDTPHQLFIGSGGDQTASRDRTLTILRTAWEGHESRQHIPEEEWMIGLTQHLENIVNLRIAHVRKWLDQNLSRFQGAGTASHASIDELKRHFENSIVDLRGNVQLCGLTCRECQLRCVRSRVHEGAHDCHSGHACVHECDFCLELEVPEARTVYDEVCVLVTRGSTLVPRISICVESRASSLEDMGVWMCAQRLLIIPKRYISVRLPYTLAGSDTGHSLHQCDARFCTIQCQLCKRLCADQDHMHGLDSSATHLCGQEHLCTALCAAPGICEIETAPHSIEATFTGRNETFQYTKYTQDAKRLKCIKPIPPGATQHKGPHNHSLDKKVVHFCQARCENCNYFCTLPLGHPQQEHETRHGSMSRTRWTVDGPDDVPLEIEGRKFSTNDEGAPMMCNLICSAMGRHVHIDYCRADNEAACTGNPELQHLTKRLHPDPGRPKDFLTHSLFWKRSGFKDPYAREEQANFAKWYVLLVFLGDDRQLKNSHGDAMCPGPEHTTAGGGAAIPSCCVLPHFHAPLNPNTTAVGTGYVSQDGHQFACRNPVVMQQAFHVIFVADHSGSMSYDDRKPLPNTPATARISARADNRYGAVLSSLHSFWTAPPIVNDFASAPDQLLASLLPSTAGGGTNFSLAIQRAGETMEQNWSSERLPVIIFLSDGECSIGDEVVQDLCRTAIRLGKAVSFHAVSFGPDGSSTYLRRMADIARDAQNNAPRDPLAPAAATILSSYTQALDTVQLAETFLGIAESLRKPRGALMH
ncbi:hypothetical protein JVU11DRAFT_9689 [Chiua virens]|nr:hypothetical protein JVU11DRAFT_9689 [Chiua virens]